MQTEDHENIRLGGEALATPSPMEFGESMDRLVKKLWECGVWYGESVREFKKRFLRRVLIANNGNQCRAARELGMHRNTLARICAELRIDVKICKRQGVYDPHANAAYSNQRRKPARGAKFGVGHGERSA